MAFKSKTVVHDNVLQHCTCPESSWKPLSNLQKIQTPITVGALMSILTVPVIQRQSKGGIKFEEKMHITKIVKQEIEKL